MPPPAQCHPGHMPPFAPSPPAATDFFNTYVCNESSCFIWACKWQSMKNTSVLATAVYYVCWKISEAWCRSRSFSVWRTSPNKWWNTHLARHLCQCSAIEACLWLSDLAPNGAKSKKPPKGMIVVMNFLPLQWSSITIRRLIRGLWGNSVQVYGRLRLW